MGEAEEVYTFRLNTSGLATDYLLEEELEEKGAYHSAEETGASVESA